MQRDTPADIFGAIYMLLDPASQSAVRQVLPQHYQAHVQSTLWQKFAIPNGTPEAYEYVAKLDWNIDLAISNAISDKKSSIARTLLDSVVLRGTSLMLTEAITLGYEDVALLLARKLVPSSIDLALIIKNKLYRLLAYYYTPGRDTTGYGTVGLHEAIRLGSTAALDVILEHPLTSRVAQRQGVAIADQYRQRAIEKYLNERYKK